MTDTESGKPPVPSERRFGWLFASIFALFGAYAVWKGAAAWSGGLLLLAVVFALSAQLAPQFLRPANMLWFRFGLLLGAVVSPIVLGFIFFTLITPVALVTRAFGRDPLRLRRGAADSYWIRRQPPGPPPDSFKNQF